MPSRVALDDSVIWVQETDERAELYPKFREDKTAVTHSTEKPKAVVGNTALFEEYDTILENRAYDEFIFDDIKGYAETLGVDEKFKACMQSLGGTPLEVMQDIQDADVTEWSLSTFRAYCTLLSLIDIVEYRRKFKKKQMEKMQKSAKNTKSAISLKIKEYSTLITKYNICAKKLTTEFKRRVSKELLDLAMFVLEYRGTYTVVGKAMQSTKEECTTPREDRIPDMYAVASYCEFRGSATPYFEMGLLPAYKLMQIEKSGLPLAEKYALATSILENGVSTGEKLYDNYTNRKLRWSMLNRVVDNIFDDNADNCSDGSTEVYDVEVIEP